MLARIPFSKDRQSDFLPCWPSQQYTQICFHNPLTVLSKIAKQSRITIRRRQEQFPRCPLHSQLGDVCLGVLKLNPPHAKHWPRFSWVYPSKWMWTAWFTRKRIGNWRDEGWRSWKSKGCRWWSPVLKDIPGLHTVASRFQICLSQYICLHNTCICSGPPSGHLCALSFLAPLFFHGGLVWWLPDYTEE